MKIVLDGVRLPLAEFELAITLELTGPVTGIIGPSGAGKTSLLDLIAGLRRPIAGTVSFDSEIVDDAGVHRPARVRHIGYVPQDNALFPHLSVKGNILYGTKSALRPEIVEVLEIGGLLSRRVISLSGGEQKRVALARALMTRPRLLLLDEPLAGIDRALQSRISEYLEVTLREFRIPAIYVTHDVHELTRLATETVTLERGRVVSA
jgi:molybdate transport system ATP-binding protein